jgi:hypothetical protein
MGKLFEDWRIGASALFSVVLIVGAFILTREVITPPSAQAGEESALLQAIATRDSDNDGLLDWEEALYGTDPQKTDSFNLGMPDGAAVGKGLLVPKAIADITVETASADKALENGELPPAPAEGTLTAAFAQNLFTFYLETKQNNGGADLTDSEVTGITNKAMNALSSSITTAPDFKTAKDLTVSGSGPDALKTFAASAEAVLMANTNTATTSEINYLQYAIQNNDQVALSSILAIAKTYRGAAAGLAVLPVPAELATVDLALINAMARMSGIIADFAREATDPLATMLAISQYTSAVLSLENAFIGVGTTYETAGISLLKGSPGAYFVNLMADVESQQLVTTTP